MSALEAFLLGIPVGLVLAATSAAWLEPRISWWPRHPCPDREDDHRAP